MDALLAELGHIFVRTDADGRRVHTEDAVRHFLFVRLVTSPDLPGALAELGDEGLFLLGEYMLRIGAATDDAPDTLQTKLTAWLAEHPVDPALAAEVRAAEAAHGATDRGHLWAKAIGRYDGWAERAPSAKGAGLIGARLAQKKK